MDCFGEFAAHAPHAAVQVCTHDQRHHHLDFVSWVPICQAICTGCRK